MDPVIESYTNIVLKKLEPLQAEPLDQVVIRQIGQNFVDDICSHILHACVKLHSDGYLEVIRPVDLKYKWEWNRTLFSDEDVFKNKVVEWLKTQGPHKIAKQTGWDVSFPVNNVGWPSIRATSTNHEQIRLFKIIKSLGT